MTAEQPQPVQFDARPIVRVDIRRRVSLGKVTRVQPGDTFLIEVGADGIIRLTPAVAAPIGSFGVAD